MVEHIESLSLVLWGVFFLAAGMYPLGFMLGAPCSACCDQSSECEPLFHRCLRELSVNGSDPGKSLRVPSLEIFTHADAALVRASEKAIVSLTVTIPPLSAHHLNPGEELVYSATIALSMGTEQWNAVIPDDATTHSISITLIGRTIDQTDPAYRAVIPAVVSQSSVTAYASLQNQFVSVSDIELDLSNTLASGCTNKTCFAVVNQSGVVKVSGREHPEYAQFYRPQIQGSIADLARDRWIVDGTVMFDPFPFRELDFGKAEQFHNGEIALRKQRNYSRYSPAAESGVVGGTFVDVTDYVDVKLAEYSPLCEMPLCDAYVIRTTIPDELLPTGVTYTPAAGEKYGCKDAYEFVLGPSVSTSPYSSFGGQSSGCSYSHATNECNGFTSKSISLLEFWQQYLLDPVANGRSTRGGWSYYCVPDILTWMEYEPPPVVKNGGTYTVGGSYDPAAGRYGKCLSGGKAYLADIDGTCHPAEISVNIGSFDDPGFWYDGRFEENETISNYVKERLSAFSGTHVLVAANQQDCTGMQYYAVAQGTEVVDLDPWGRARTRRDDIHLRLNYRTNYYGTNYGPIGCDRDSAFDHLTIGGRIAISRQASSFPISAVGEQLSVYSLWYGANAPEVLTTSYYTSFPGFEVGPGSLGQTGYWSVGGREVGYSSDGASYYALYPTSSVSTSNGGPMPSCSGVSYAPSNFVIDNTASVGRQNYGSPWLWGDTEGTNLTVTVSPTGRFELCGGATTSFGPFYNDRSQDRVYTRYAFSDGSGPTPITVTVKGTCIAYPQGLFVSRQSPPGLYGLMQYYYTVDYYGLHFGYPQDFENGGCVMVPIKTNGSECGWSVTSDSEWLTLAEGTNTGTGDGRVNVLFDPLDFYNGVFSREGNLTLSCNGRTTTIKVRQGGYRFE